MRAWLWLPVCKANAEPVLLSLRPRQLFLFTESLDRSLAIEHMTETRRRLDVALGQYTALIAADQRLVKHVEDVLELFGLIKDPTGWEDDYWTLQSLVQDRHYWCVSVCVLVCVSRGCLSSYVSVRRV